MTEWPAGTVTFLFTDIEGSTRLWEEHGTLMPERLARHDNILRTAIEGHRGVVVKTTGDGVHAAFWTAGDAIDAAVAAQLALRDELGDGAAPISVRMGIHAGAADFRDGDYYGSTLNRAARLMAVGHGGQVLLSGVTSELVRDRSVELRDLGEHRLRDLGEAEHIFQVLHPRLASSFPPLGTLDTFPTNLPVQPTSFVGRESDVEAVLAALSANRIVSLIGVGGVGKTRLAVHSAARALAQFRDGVWLCELAPLSDAAAVPDIVASVLGVQQRPGESFADSLVAALRTKDLLVVLDNCEHVLDATATLVDSLVTSCPGVSVLATGREGLGVAGEQLLMVRSLAMPQAGAPQDEILTSAAVQLFVERAELAGGSIGLGAATRDAIPNLCRRLDGIPLAIELAAARTRMMSPIEIAARIDERFRLLTGGSRTAIERHRTLRQTVDWSYDLLEPIEQHVLDRLGVFASGFTLPAAEATVTGDDVEDFEVIDAVARLVDKSLVVADRAEDRTRYRLLETIRQYALERLDERAETDALRRRHAQWCISFEAETAVGARTPQEADFVARLNDEIEELRAAITWAVGAHESDLAMELVGAEPALIFNTPIGYMFLPWSRAVLQLPGVERHPRFGIVLALRAADHRHHDRFADAERDAEQAIAVMSDPERVYSNMPWAVWMQTLVFQGRAADFLPATDAWLQQSRERGTPYQRIQAMALVATVLSATGDPSAGLTLGAEALRLAHELAVPSLIGMASAAESLASMEIDPDRALTVTLDQLDHAANDLGATVALGRLGRAPQYRRRGPWAARFAGVLERTFEAGDARLLLVQLDNLSGALVLEDRVESAARLYGLVGASAGHIDNDVSARMRARVAAMLDDALGSDRAAALISEGARMELSDAYRLAATELELLAT